MTAPTWTKDRLGSTNCRDHDGRPRARAVRDDVALPLPVRAADARARAARRDHADALAPDAATTHWLRLTRFFGTLFLINFAIGVATGLVQEFQFGMNWSVYSKFVGNVFGAPLAIEGLAAFFLESTFLGLWIFGWNRLSPRLHLATIWIAVARHVDVGVLHPRRELVDAAPGRLQDRRTARRS